jgi:hypothetical protein
MRSWPHAGASNSAYNLPGTAQPKSGSSAREFAAGENSVNNIISVAHVSTEVDVQGPALYLINRRAEGDMALDYNTLSPNVIPATETANTGSVRHSESEDFGLRLAGWWRSDETPDSTRVPFSRRGL